MVIMGWFSDNLFHSIYPSFRKTVDTTQHPHYISKFHWFSFHINCLALQRPRYETVAVGGQETEDWTTATQLHQLNPPPAQ